MVETLRAHGFTLLLLLNTLARRMSDFPNPDETPLSPP